MICAICKKVATYYNSLYDFEGHFILGICIDCEEKALNKGDDE